MALSTSSPASLPLTYFERWHRHAKKPIGPLSEETARERHEALQPYVVVAGPQSAPLAFIEIAGDFCGVSFLDEWQREYLMYTFEALEQDRVFLREATHREFEGSSDVVVRGTVYRFWPDGRMMIERAEQPFRRSSVDESSADVAHNWEKRPSFGRYGQLLRKDR